jgi:hypothetical protein
MGVRFLAFIGWSARSRVNTAPAKQAAAHSVSIRALSQLLQATHARHADSPVCVACVQVTQLAHASQANWPCLRVQMVCAAKVLWSREARLELIPSSAAEPDGSL